MANRSVFLNGGEKSNVIAQAFAFGEVALGADVGELGVSGGSFRPISVGVQVVVGADFSFFPVADIYSIFPKALNGDADQLLLLNLIDLHLKQVACCPSYLMSAFNSANPVDSYGGVTLNYKHTGVVADDTHIDVLFFIDDKQPLGFNGQLNFPDTQNVNVTNNALNVVAGASPAVTYIHK